MSDNKFWQSFAELHDKERVRKTAQDEFPEELPFGDIGGSLLDAKTPRRDFLKYIGFSTAAATLAASCKTPVRKAVPFVNRPENTVPGVAKYYASTFVQDGDALPIVVKVRDGRPIKIEGNELCEFTGGGTSARAQASVLDLYDTYRLPHPKRKSGNAFQEVPTFDQLDNQIATALAGLGGAPVVLLTGTINSPSTRQIISEFLGRYPGSRHVQYDAVSCSGLLMANGGRIPAYRFDRARVIVSLGADFLGSWVAPVEFAYQYAQGRKIDERHPSMSRHYQFESFLSMTGASADERFTHRPSETGLVAAALHAALGGGQGPALDPALAGGIMKAAGDLKAAQGAALVVCGSNDPYVQAIVAAINQQLGAEGSTIESGISLNYRRGIDADMASLVSQMNAGQIGALLIWGANPAYDYHDPARFRQGMQKVGLTVSFNEKLDETSELCQYIIPNHHFLESWGDAEPRSGYISFIQPTIFPLFKTRPFQTSLLKWSGNNTDYETYFRNFWISRAGGQQGFDKALMDGILVAGIGTSPTEAVIPGISLGDALGRLPATPRRTGTEVMLYEQVAIGSGRQAGNPWLLELPDPITRATWDNYALISLQKADELGIDYRNSDYEYYPEKPVIEITANGQTKRVPAMVIPGMDPNTIAIAVGYGRSERFSKAASEVGVNVFDFARWNGVTVDNYNEATTSSKSVGKHRIAQMQIHNSYEGRTEVVKETTMATFLRTPDMYKNWRQELHDTYAPKTGNYRQEATLYGDPHDKPGLKWGMSIDLNSCTGCHACVVACHAENNVPVVGKNEVLRYHDMHWLRIDRYFVSEPGNPDNLKAVIFQPMLCQHCDNAPCENVCPVAATMHSAEGINQMAYNRCIGTRYCANNCPYKVRRFNWSDYTGASTHGVLGPSSGVGKLNEAVFQMNDDLTRMVLNPDVVTRSRGVMEKCTFCIQRTQEKKLQAKMENRVLGGDEVQSACSQACPTNAIVFGNVHDGSSMVSQIRQNNPQRLFYVLEQIHTLPNVNYLAKIRNTEELIRGKTTGSGAKSEHARESTHEPVRTQSDEQIQQQ